MNNRELNQRFTELSTPLLSDACLRLQIPIRMALPGIRPVSTKYHIAGRVLPVQHFGSVDIFLEAMGTAQPGDILVIDNNGRKDEGCIGDLTVLEAQASNLAGLIVWGVHRDTPELLKIEFPVFSYGVYPAGPTRVDQRTTDALNTAHFGHFSVTKEDIVFADADGVLFTPGQFAEQLLDTATDIWQKERQQAQAILAGHLLRDQLDFEAFIAKRAVDETYTFRQHLRAIGGAIEE